MILLGIAELADEFDTSRQRAHQIANTKGFPEPIARLAMGPIWSLDDVQSWVMKHPRRRTKEARLSE